jgi:hypothetical protein
VEIRANHFEPVTTDERQAVLPCSLNGTIACLSAVRAAIPQPNDATNPPTNIVSATRIQFIRPPLPVPVAILVVNSLESELECDKSSGQM